MTTRGLVIVVDDDPSILGAVERLLKVRGFDTEVFNTVESFLDRANLCDATCLVLDIHLNGMSGIELRRQLSSGPGDFHLRALPEPYVNLSIHTAPIVQPLPWHSDQWARSVGFARRNRSNQSLAPLV
jgi:CheY-like chemotaxis protein